MVPLFGGLGYTIIALSCICGSYYSTVCAWSFMYMFASFQRELPWTNCADGEEWHTPNCYSRELAKQCRTQQEDINSSHLAWTWYNGSCIDMTTYCIQHGYTGGRDNATTVENVIFHCITEDKYVGKNRQLNLFLI